MDESTMNNAADAGMQSHDAEKRRKTDRRKTPTSPWAAFWPWGRRMVNRRAEEHRRPYFVDRFEPLTFVAVMTLIFASLADAFLTIQLLEAGAKEVNPLMDHLLSHGVLAFLLGKYALTVCGLPLLLIFQNHYLFGTFVRVRHLLPIAILLYAVLIGYQIALIQAYILTA